MTYPSFSRSAGKTGSLGRLSRGQTNIMNLSGCVCCLMSYGIELIERIRWEDACQEVK